MYDPGSLKSFVVDVANGGNNRNTLPRDLRVGAGRVIESFRSISESDLICTTIMAVLESGKVYNIVNIKSNTLLHIPNTKGGSIETAYPPHP